MPPSLRYSSRFCHVPDSTTAFERMRRKDSTEVEPFRGKAAYRIRCLEQQQQADTRKRELAKKEAAHTYRMIRERRIVKANAKAKSQELSPVGSEANLTGIVDSLDVRPGLFKRVVRWLGA